TLGGLFSVIIKRNTPYPVTETKFGFRTIEDHQTEVLFRVFQGERPVCVANQFLDKFVLRNIPSKWAGEVRISVTMKIDENRILKVYATEQSTGIRKGIKIENANGKLTDAEIKQFIEKAERMKQDDEKLKQKIKARNKLQLLAYDLRRFANDEYPRKFHNENTRRIVRKKVDEVLKWFNSNPIVPIDLIEAKYEDLLLIKRK
ncbi:hsp70-like protein, partial [Leptotrombidium deliense]